VPEGGGHHGSGFGRATLGLELVAVQPAVRHVSLAKGLGL
jgi:hypothetical protein